MSSFKIEFRILHTLLYMNIIYTNSYIMRLINFSIFINNKLKKMVDFKIEFRIVHPLLYMNIIYTNSYIIRLINFSIFINNTN